jgi:hypothetical protein
MRRCRCKQSQRTTLILEITDDLSPPGVPLLQQCAIGSQPRWMRGEPLMAATASVLRSVRRIGVGDAWLVLRSRREQQ